MPLLKRAATELVTGTEDSDARLRSCHFPASRSSAPPSKAPALREGETLATSFALSPPRPSRSGRGGGARSGARAVTYARAVAVGTTPASRPLPRGSRARGIPELSVSTSTSRYLRILPSCGGIHPTVTSEGLWLSPLPAAPDSARPQSRMKCSFVHCMQLGGNNPLAAVLRPCPAEDHFLYFSKVYVRMMCTAKKCGIRFQPPAIILIYENEMKGKSRQRIMPVRNFSKFSDCSRAAEQLKNNPRHKDYLEQVSLRQLEKLFSFLRGYLWGQSLAETMEQIQRETTLDPEEDLNKLDDKELAKRKSIMDELFEKNQKKKDDPNFVYDIEVEFPQDEQLQSCGWDTESADEF